MSNSRPPRNPESQIATMISTSAIFARRTPDMKRHGPATGGDLTVWRGGVRYVVTRHGLRRAR